MNGALFWCRFETVYKFGVLFSFGVLLCALVYFLSSFFHRASIKAEGLLDDSSFHDGRTIRGAPLVIDSQQLDRWPILGSDRLSQISPSHE